MRPVHSQDMHYNSFKIVGYDKAEDAWIKNLLRTQIHKLVILDGMDALKPKPVILLRLGRLWIIVPH